MEVNERTLEKYGGERRRVKYESEDMQAQRQQLREHESMKTVNKGYGRQKHSCRRVIRRRVISRQ